VHRADSDGANLDDARLAHGYSKVMGSKTAGTGIGTWLTEDQGPAAAGRTRRTHPHRCLRAVSASGGGVVVLPRHAGRNPGRGACAPRIRAGPPPHPFAATAVRVDKRVLVERLDDSRRSALGAAPFMRGVAAERSDGTERLAAGGPQGSPDPYLVLCGGPQAPRPKCAVFHKPQ